MSIWVCSFWTLAVGTSAADGGVDREELAALLLSGADSAGVVPVVSTVA